MVFLLPLTQLWKQDRIILIIRLAGKMQVEISGDIVVQINLHSWDGSYAKNASVADKKVHGSYANMAAFGRSHNIHLRCH